MIDVHANIKKYTASHKRICLQDWTYLKRKKERKKKKGKRKERKKGKKYVVNEMMF